MRALEETNPMLGARGVRLGVIHPEIYEMQVRAIARAERAVSQRTGHAPRLEIMIPLVAYERELELVRARVVSVAGEEGLSCGADFSVVTMIELPRACMIADRIAHHADFFSFGTNDFTQAGIGFSRDDVEGRIIPSYVEEKILDDSPFAQIDEPGVGELVQIAVQRGRRERPELELGVCGEHGDPDSIRFFHEGARLRELLGVSRADRPCRGRPGGDRRVKAAGGPIRSSPQRPGARPRWRLRQAVVGSCSER